jgi:DNA polymerase-3 subunit delta
MKADDAITCEEALQSLHPEKLSPCYFIYGEERVFVNQLLGWFLEKGIKEEARAFDYNRLEGGRLSPEEVVSFAKSYPMAGSRRLVVLDDVDKIKDPKGHLLSYLETPSLKTVMLFIAQKPDMRTKFFALLKNRATTIHCRPLYDNEVPRFIRQEASRQGLRLTEEAVWSLKESLGTNLYLIRNELEKIAITTPLTNPPQPTEAVRSLSPVGGVFELTAAVGEKDVAKGLQVLSLLLLEGEPPLLILSMLIRHFRMMATTKEGL